MALLIVALVLGACGTQSSKPVSFGRLVLSTDGATAYITDHNLNGLRIVDVHDAANPKVLGTVSISADGNTHADGITLSPDGTKVYMGISDTNLILNKGGAVQIVDVAHPDAPQRLGSYVTGAYEAYKYGLGATPDGATLFGLTEDGNLTYLNVADPAHPTVSANQHVSSYGPCVSNTAATRVYCAQQIIDTTASD